MGVWVYGVYGCVGVWVSGCMVCMGVWEWVSVYEVQVSVGVKVADVLWARMGAWGVGVGVKIGVDVGVSVGASVCECV